MSSTRSQDVIRRFLLMACNVDGARLTLRTRFMMFSKEMFCCAVVLLSVLQRQSTVNGSRRDFTHLQTPSNHQCDFRFDLFFSFSFVLVLQYFFRFSFSFTNNQLISNLLTKTC